MATVDVRKADERPRDGSGYYVAWMAGIIPPDVCYWNSRDHRWSRDGIRVTVTHYEDRKLMERKHADG
jgi:hypothetical protein